jgi:hypothetical protein
VDFAIIILIFFIFRAFVRSIIYKQPKKCTSLFIIYFNHNFITTRLGRYCGHLQSDNSNRIPNGSILFVICVLFLLSLKTSMVHKKKLDGSLLPIRNRERKSLFNPSTAPRDSGEKKGYGVPYNSLVLQNIWCMIFSCTIFIDELYKAVALRDDKTHFNGLWKPPARLRSASLIWNTIIPTPMWLIT